MLMLRSCASSRAITEQCRRRSLSYIRTESTRLLCAWFVSLRTCSAPHTPLPTRRTPSHPNATRRVALTAPTLRGFVTPIRGFCAVCTVSSLPSSFFWTLSHSSSKCCDICVTLPQPVYPITMTTLLSRTALIISSSNACTLGAASASCPFCCF